MLFKQFGGVDAVPICLATTDVEEIIATVARLAPSFGGINLEDISAPRCFEIEDRLKAMLDIPVFHDDQHGTAVVALAALQNALLLTGRTPATARVVISGAGAAGVAVARILLEAGVGDIAVVDRQGVLNSRRSDLTPVKKALAVDTGDRHDRHGSLADVMAGADVYIGVSGGHRAGGGRRDHGRRRDHLRAREPDARGAARGRPPACPDRGDRTLRLPQPDQQRARVPRHLPRRLRGARHRDHGGHEARRGRRPGRPGRRRPGRGPDHPVAVRPARRAGGHRGRRGRGPAPTGSPAADAVGARAATPSRRNEAATRRVGARPAAEHAPSRHVPTRRTPSAGRR